MSGATGPCPRCSHGRGFHCAICWPLREPTHFLGGDPIPPGYLTDVGRMVELVCAIEEQVPEWELEA